jgi:hypothetical protein
MDVDRNHLKEQSGFAIIGLFRFPSNFVGNHQEVNSSKLRWEPIRNAVARAVRKWFGIPFRNPCFNSPSKSPLHSQPISYSKVPTVPQFQAQVLNSALDGNNADVCFRCSSVMSDPFRHPNNKLCNQSATQQKLTVLWLSQGATAGLATAGSSHYPPFATCWPLCTSVESKPFRKFQVSPTEDTP